MSFPVQLRKLRTARGWRQSDVAERTGLLACAIAHFENGRRSPTLKNLIRFADCFKIGLDELVGRKLR